MTYIEKLILAQMAKFLAVMLLLAFGWAVFS